ncbi:DHHW family protein [Fusibacter bizertensis]|uniref:DHHW family protein n=1 Tax=Fusibacter bizertensis TaxID=1488331 RepID=A0ABT6NCS8_9FIRM|nr:DHHW family protein [Fusibacter bizertensis]MDH8678228.1 DHHW family protein [Fusibacter bizertensis]
MHKLKRKQIVNLITVTIFFISIVAFSILHLFMDDEKISLIERRRLEQFPKFTVSKLLTNQWLDSFESYLLDQFPMREQVKYLDISLKQVVFKNGDVDGFYRVGEYLSKILYSYNESDVIHNADKISELYNRYLMHMNVYMAIVPDKGYFTADHNGYPSIDYKLMVDTFMKHLDKNITYIDVFPLLTLKQYYYTDAHWRQEEIYPVAETIAKKMSVEISDEKSYELNSYAPFNGVYFGRSEGALQSETLNYLTNQVINHAVVTYQDESEEHRVYDLKNLENLDAYDVFLGGPQPIVNIMNYEATTKKELIVFRDSFGSSLTPLLLSGYSKVTLIDIRYMDLSKLNDYIDFTDQDVLFVYNTTVLNNRVNFK